MPAIKIKREFSGTPCGRRSTPCPMDNTIMIDSSVCHKCKFFKGANQYSKYILCGFSVENEAFKAIRKSTAIDRRNNTPQTLKERSSAVFGRIVDNLRQEAK